MSDPITTAQSATSKINQAENQIPIANWLTELESVFPSQSLADLIEWLNNPGILTNQIENEALSYPVISILINYSGLCPELLEETLFSIFVQSSDDYEVIIGTSEACKPEISSLLQYLPVSLANRIRIVGIEQQEPALRFNALAEAANGIFLNFIDENTLLFEHHVEVIKKALTEHGSRKIMQVLGVSRTVKLLNNTLEHFSYTVENIDPSYTTPFNSFHYAYHPNVPLACLVIPRVIFKDTKLRFREELEVPFDWVFLMRLANFIQVETASEITISINFIATEQGSDKETALLQRLAWLKSWSILTEVSTIRQVLEEKKNTGNWQSWRLKKQNSNSMNSIISGREISRSYNIGHKD